MPPWLAIALKDLRLLARDPMALFWVLAFPVVFGLFFGSIMKVGPDARRAPIEVIVVEHQQPDHRERDARFARGLDEAGLSVQRMPKQAALTAVQQGRAAMFIDLPAPAEMVPVQLGVDPARSAETAMATGVVRAVLLRSLAGRPIALPPLETREVSALAPGPRTGYEAVFAAMVVWGLLGCAAAFAVALVSERTAGTLLRLYAAPFGRGSIVAGKALACAVACVGGAALLTLLGVLLLGVRIADPLKYLAAVLAASACFVGLTQLLGTLGKTEQAVAGAGWSVLIVLAMCGGAMVPRMLMPEWLLAASDLSPVAWSVRALEGATFRDLPWSQMLWPLSSLAGLGALTFSAAAATLWLREQ